MKLTKQDVSYITTVVNAAKFINLDAIIIEPGLVRGIDEERTTLILHSDNVPTLSCGSIGISRMKVYESRFNLVNDAQMEVEATVDTMVKTGQQFARLLTFKSKGTKVEYRCANPNTVRIPRELNTEDTFQADFHPTAFSMIHRGMAAMVTKECYIGCNGTSMFVELVDDSSDVLRHEFGTAAIRIDGKGDVNVFKYKYDAPSVLTLFKTDPTISFVVTSTGLLKTRINGLTAFLIPKVN